MVELNAVFSKKNQQLALNHLSTKKNGCGTDQVSLADLEDYWKANGERIIQDIEACTYEPGLVAEYEIVNGSGKKRKVTRLNTIDRYLTRLLAQKLEEYYDPKFLGNSCAYRDGKGIQVATDIARDFIEAGNEYVVEIDIKDFFDEISIEKLLEILETDINDKRVLSLIKKYLYCSITNDGNVYKKEKGVLQGNSISPILSNVYLHVLDAFMEEHKYNWVRFSDNINIYVSSMEVGEMIFEEVTGFLLKELYLKFSIEKSGIFDAFERRFLGYDFIKKKGKVLTQRHVFQQKDFLLPLLRKR